MDNKAQRQPLSQFLILTIFRTLLFFSFLTICNTSIPNFDLSSPTTLDPIKTGFTVTGKSASQTFAQSVKAAGDVNGDGYDDLIIGGIAENVYNYPGEVHVIYGGPNSLLQNVNFASITLDPATTGFTISGIQQTDKVGTAVSGAGDFNNDGYDDILVSTGLYKGEVYVIYGRKASKLQNIVIGSTVLDPATTGFMIKQNAYEDGFGNSLGAAGDVDGDGFGDIIVGAPRKTGYRGAAYVIYGRDKAEQQNIVLTTDLIPAVDGFMMMGNYADDQLGFSVSSAGDIDDDGYDDIVIGAPKKNQSKGTVYVIYGGPRSTLQNIALTGTGITLTVPSAGFYITGDVSNSYFGCSVSTAGDFNHDGFDDIIIGANGYSGAAYVVYGGPRSTLQNIALSSSVALQPDVDGFTITGNGGNLGVSVSIAGDVNGDGYSDIIIGANEKDSSKGAVYVIYGTPKASAQNIPLASVILDPAMSGFTITGGTYGDGLGVSVSAAGDINGDGYDDIVIGTRYKKVVYLIHAACVSTSGPCTKRNFCQACAEEVNPLSSRCQTCPSNCKQFPSPKACEVCDEGYFLSTSTSLCESCSGNCKKCSNPTVCQICKETYFLYQSKCFKPCPLSTFSSGGICEDCSSHCSSCTSLESCQTCDDGYYLYKSQCVEACPEGTFGSAWNCLDCSSHCSSCTSLESCQTCESGFTLINSQCIIATPTPPITPITTSPIPPPSLTVENTAIQRLGSSVTGVGSAISVGNPTFPLTKIVSKIVQNTRYLNLPVTPALQEIYQTWDADLISWDFPDDLDRLNHFKTTPRVFSQYEIGSPFSFNFWSTIITIAVALIVWIVVSFLLFFFERKKPQGKIYSLLEILAAGSLNFALVQAYGCMDDIVLYFLLDLKTNPYNSIFAWTSFACGVTFLSLGALFMLLNIFKVRKYQRLKREGLAKKNMRELERFNQDNKKWELFYADFNDHDIWSHSFLAFLIVRSCLSSLVIASLHEHVLIQTIALLVLDIVVILFLIIKKPFATLRGKLAQYYFEIITLPVHICTFILAFQTSRSEISASLNETLCTCIIYLNTALITGTTGFMFIEIYKTISQWIKSQRDNAVHPITEEDPKLVPAKKFSNAATNTEQNLPLSSSRNQEAETERFHFLSGFDQSQNISFSGVTLQNSEIENSLVPDLDSSDRIISLKKPQATPAIARRRLLDLTNPQKNKSMFTAHAEEVETQEL